MNTLATAINDVKRAKATALYWKDVQAYDGSERHALRALDCLSREEAITMLSAVQRVSVFKHDGKVIIE